MGGKATELLWLHGIHDAVVHTDVATAQAKELTQLGVPLDFRLSFDYGHETTDEELQAFRNWLLKKMAKPQPPEEEELPAVEADGETHALKQDPWGAPQRVPSKQGHH